MNKILKKVKENQTQILIGGVIILTGVVLTQKGIIVFQKNMFNQLAMSIDELGLGEQVNYHMINTPPYPWI